MITLSTTHAESACGTLYDILQAGGISDDLRLQLEFALNDCTKAKAPRGRYLKANYYQWVSRAAAKTNFRECLKVLHGLDGWLVGVDGFRMHAMRSGLDGTLKPATKKSQEAPDDGVMPSVVESASVIKVFNNKKDACLKTPMQRDLWANIKNQKLHGGKLAIGVKDSNEKFWFYDYKFLYDASATTEILHYYISADGELLIEIDCNHYAVIMPHYTRD